MNSCPFISTVQINDSLAGDSWNATVVRTGNGSWTGPATVSSGAPAGGRIPIVVTASEATPQPSHRFLRLRVELP